MGNYGIKIAKAGANINSSDPDDYNFWSKYRGKSIRVLLTLEVTTNSGTDPATAVNSYQHNFGYIPQFMVFTVSQIAGEYVNMDWAMTTGYGKSGDIQSEYLNAYATSTHIYVEALWEYGTPMSGTTTGIVNTYAFDIILFMEEVETS